MKSKITFIFLFLLILNATDSAFGNDLIGYRHEGVRFGEKLPNGAQDQGGSLLSDERYGVTRFKKDKKYMLWFEKIISRNKAGVPRWEVRDVLKFEKLSRNQEFFYSYYSPCVMNGEYNPDLIVMAQTSPRSKRKTVLKAWIADVSTEKFRAVSIKKVSCK